MNGPPKGSHRIAEINGSMNITNYLVKSSDGIQTVMQVINNNKDGIALVVDGNDVLVGTVTDGDIRRFMLSGRSLDEPCSRVMYERPTTANVHTCKEELVRLIKTHRIRNIPIVDDHGKPVRLFNFSDLIDGADDQNCAVIMAGGEGLRLRPLTENLPKPMIKVGGTPVLEQIVRNLKCSGIETIFISINYRGEMIESHFRDGASLGVRIRYLREKKKLGTAGPLSLLQRQRVSSGGQVLVINGDVVTDVGFDRLLEFHSQHRSVLSVAAIEYRLNIPYGVLNIAGNHVVSVEEKPTRRFLCNAGIYVIEPDILHLVPENRSYDMTDLLRDVIKRGLPVSTFPIHEHWVDIGRLEDLRRVEKRYHLAPDSKEEKGDG